MCFSLITDEAEFRFICSFSHLEFCVCVTSHSNLLPIVILGCLFLVDLEIFFFFKLAMPSLLAIYTYIFKVYSFTLWLTSSLS